MYKTVTIGLKGGMDQSTPALTGRGDDDFNSVINCDYGFKEELRGRPGFVDLDGFGTRGLASTGVAAADTGTTAWASLPAAAKVNPQIVRIRDARGERPAVTSQGHIWTREDGRWTDRLHHASTKVSRVCDWLSGQAFHVNGSYNPPPAAGSTLGPLLDPNSTQVWGILGSAGTLEYRQAGNPFGVGNSARNVNGLEAVVLVNGNALLWNTATAGNPTLSAINLAVDAQTPAGTGDAPCICADYDSVNFYVAYATTTAHTVKILKVNPAGTILNTATFTYGTGTITGVWIANSSIATGKVIAVAVDSVSTQPFSTLRGQSALATFGLDLTSSVFASGSVGPVVVGCADQGSAWMLFKDNTGAVNLLTRSMTAASEVKVMTITGGTAGQQPFADVGTQGRHVWITHQPIDVSGRVIIGLTATSFWNGLNNNATAAATWYSFDVTDLWRQNTTTGTRLRPTIIAQGPRDQTMPVAGPAAAVVVSSTTWRTITVDYRLVQATNGLQGTTALGPIVGVSGTGTLGVNEIAIVPATADHAGESTIFSGSVPHEMARGDCHEAGFPFSRPAILVSPTAGSTFIAGTYGFYAVWRWTDEAGQIHRSEPSFLQTATTGGTTNYTVVADGPLTEREYDEVYVEVYVTDNTGAGNHQLCASAKVTARDGGHLSVTITPTVGVGPVLYTDGGGLANTPPHADGGVAVVGHRMWTSDGTRVFASQLPVSGLAPCWSTAGPLTVTIPASAGRVVSLAGVDDKVVVACERGVYWVTGQGPDNTGVGAAFSYPAKLSDLGIAKVRHALSIPGHGVLLFSNQTSSFDDTGYGGGTYGGLWSIDRALTVQRVSWPAQVALEVGIVDMAYSTEREAVYLALSGSSGVTVVWDLRAKKWGTWLPVYSGPVPPVSSAVVAGQLWQFGTLPGSYSTAPGNDTLVGAGTSPYAMSFTTNNLASDETDGLGWGRVRSIRTLGELPPGSPGNSYSLTYTAILDQLTTLSKNFTVLTTGVTTWPTGRAAPEWRLPQQKCSSIQITTSVTPAVAAWTALALQVLPLGRAPANQRG
jgi:hypothetical protein